MALPRDEVCTGLIYELGQFATLIRPLTAEQWDTPTRCEGWTVGDVARHAIGSMTDVNAGRLDGLGTPEVTAREVSERVGHTPAQLADECTTAIDGTTALLPMFDDAVWNGPAGGGYNGTLGDGVEALWFDVFMHADDIRSALGIPSVIGPGLRGALSHVRPFLNDFGWHGTIPAETEPDAFEFVLVATGRTNAPAGAEHPPVNIYA